MDFAAQLAKLERQAGNAVRNNNSANSSTATNQPTSERGDNNNIHHADDHDPRRRRRYSRDRSPYHNDTGREDDRSIRRRYGHHSNNNYNNNNNSSDYQHHYRGSRNLPPPNVSNNKYPFQELQQLGYRIRPSLPWVPKSDRTKPHICLLAIVIDDLPYEHIWRAWANPSVTTTTTCANHHHHCHVSLVCHAKYPKRVQSPWLRQRLLVQPPQLGRGDTTLDPTFHTHVPEWGSIHIARAMIDCLKDGVLIGTQRADDLTDERYTPNRYYVTTTSSLPNTGSSPRRRDIPTVDKFIFISESCLPVMTLDEYGQVLFPPVLEETGTTTTTTTGTTATAVTAAFTKADDHIPTSRSGDTDSMNQVLVSNQNIELNNIKGLEDAKISEAGDDANVNLLATTTKAAATATAITPPEQKSVVAVVDPWDVSWVNGRSRQSAGTPRNMYENHQFQNLDARIPDSCRFKADQWILLSRRHAVQILTIDEHITHPPHQFWTLFQRISASDEMYFPTSLGILGLLKDDDDAVNVTKNSILQQKQQQQQQPTSLVLKRSVTYTDWSQGMRNPTSFTNGRRDFETVARLARKQECLLARKFVVVTRSGDNSTTAAAVEIDARNQNHSSSGQITVNEWMSIVQQLSEQQPET